MNFFPNIIDNLSTIKFIHTARTHARMIRNTIVGATLCDVACTDWMWLFFINWPNYRSLFVGTAITSDWMLHNVKNVDKSSKHATCINSFSLRNQSPLHFYVLFFILKRCEICILETLCQLILTKCIHFSCHF